MEKRIFSFLLQKKGQNKPGKSPAAVDFISDAGCADYMKDPKAGATDLSLSPKGGIGRGSRQGILEVRSPNRTASLTET